DALLSILFGALGTEWLDRVAEDVPPSTPLPITRHHIGHIISVAGEAQVIEALELAISIETLYDVPGIDAVISQLRTDGQYWQTLCHLTVASRLRRAGARELRLEPPAAEGQLSDISFVVGTTGYQAECYRPTYSTKGDAKNEMMRLGQ